MKTHYTAVIFFAILIMYQSLFQLSAEAINWGGDNNTEEEIKKIVTSPEVDVLGRPIYFYFDPSYSNPLDFDTRPQDYSTKGPNGTPLKFYLINYTNANPNNDNNGRDTTPYFMWYAPIPMETDLSITSLNAYDMSLLKENRQLVAGDSVGEWLVAKNSNLPYRLNLKYGAIDPWGSEKWNYPYGNTGFRQILTGDFKGKYYEWRYGGYIQNGNAIPNPYFAADEESSSLAGVYDPYQRDMEYAKRTTWIEFRDSTFAKSLWGEHEFSDQEMAKWIKDIFFRDHPAFKAVNADPYHWIPYIGAANNPEDYAGVWYGHRIESNGREYYNVLMSKVPEDKMGLNMRLVSYEVREKDTNKVIATFTRNENNEDISTGKANYITKFLKKGKTYVIKTRVKNMVDPELANNPNYSTYIEGKKTTLETMYQYDEMVGKFHQFNEPVKEQYALPTHETTIKPGEVATFEYEYTVPENQKPTEKIQLMAQIPVFYYFKGKNFNDQDDDAQLVFEFEKENLRIHFDGYYDSNKNLAEAVITGEPIWVKYLIEKTNDGKDVNPADAIIQMSDGQGGVSRGVYYSAQSFTKNNEPITNNTLSKNGDYAVVWASYTSNTGTFCTQGQIPSHWKAKGLNADPTDDYIVPPCLTTPRNIVVQNVNATPDTIFLEESEASRTVTYNLDWEVAYYSTDKNSVVSFPVVTTAGGQRKIQFVGMRANTTIPMQDTFTLNVREGQYKFTVEANHTRVVVESSSKGANPYIDNTGWDMVNVLRSLEPRDYQCPNGVQRVNEWSTTFSINESWGTWIDQTCAYTYYDSEGNAVGVTYYDCSYCQIDRTNSYTETIDFYERFEITKIMFKSKYSEDHQGGWINLLDGQTGIIKAGGGFNFYVEVEYQTNRRALQPPSYSGCAYTKSVTPTYNEAQSKHSLEIIMPLKDDSGRNLYLYPSASISGDWDNRLYRFDIESKHTANESEAMYYTHVDATNTGAVGGKITTTPIAGSPDKPYVNDLCDIAYFNLEIRGSYLDDIKTHIVQ